MGAMLTGLRALGAALVLIVIAVAQSASAATEAQIEAACTQPTPQAQAAAFQALAQVDAKDPAAFAALVNGAAACSTEENAGALASALVAGGLAGGGNNEAITRQVVNAMVVAQPGAGGDILAAVLGAGGNQQVATAVFADAIATAASQRLSLVPVLPPLTPGTGVNLTGQGNVKEEGLTTRLGLVGEGVTTTAESPQSPTTPQ
jgi:hypothetical protein